MMSALEFFQGKSIFVTGHTGFKGSWLSKILVDAGAQLTGYSLAPEVDPCLFSMMKLGNKMSSIIGDVRDLKHMLECFQRARPEIVIHMAAQPLVRLSYEQPIRTYETNVMGTVNLLECIRATGCVRSFLNVTTDKVYQNNEWAWGYRESDPLDGYDPYSNSKSCSELVTHGYKNAFFNDSRVAISTARAGNVIGGGDFAKDRIVPDCVRAAIEKRVIAVRNPYSIRPYQHVLEALMTYLMIVEAQYKDKHLAGYYNIGPNDSDCVNTKDLVTLFCDTWKEGLEWKHIGESGPHEATFLKLDCSKIKATFAWQPVWNIETAIKKTVDWSKAYQRSDDVSCVAKAQIEDYIACQASHGLKG